MANLVVAQLLFLESENPDKDIHLYINSPGGVGHCRLCRSTTPCSSSNLTSAPLCWPGGQHGRFCLSGGANGQALLPAALQHDDPSAAGGFQGQATDIDIHAREILETRDRLNRIMARHTGQPLETIARDTDRDNFMSGAQAVDYGLIDTVLDSRGELPSTVTE